MGKEQRGIKTVEVAGKVLQSVVSQAEPLSLSQIAEFCEMSPSQVYTYLVSLSRIGLIKRNIVTQNFEPGFLSLRLGIESALNDPRISKVFSPLDDFCKIEQQNSFVSVWSEHGPVVIRYREWSELLDISFNIGSYLSLTQTSTGILYSAFMPEDIVSGVISNSKFTDESTDIFHSREYRSRINEIRKKGFSKLTGTPTPSISSIAIPVFDRNGKILYSITIFNKTESLSNSAKDRIARRVSEIISV